MSKKYRTGFERLAELEPDTDERYKNALIEVKRHFVGFTQKAGYNVNRPERLSSAAKKQIRRYYNMLTEYTEGGPVYLMTPAELPKTIKRNKHNIDAVKRAALMHEGRKRSKFIFVPYDGETIPIVEVRNNVPVFFNATKGFGREVIELNHDALADDVMSTVADAVARAPGAKFYRVLGGDAGRNNEFYGVKGSISAAADYRTLARYIASLMTDYNTGNHAWQNWLFGIAAYYGTATAREVIGEIRATKDAWRDTSKRIIPGESFDERIARLAKEVKAKRG